MLGALPFIILAVCIILTFLLARTWEWGDIGAPFCFVFSIILILALIVLPISRADYKAQILQYKAIERTVEAARKRNINLETAALTHKIIEQNQWLESLKYWNGTIFDWYIPDTIEELEPLK